MIKLLVLALVIWVTGCSTPPDIVERDPAFSSFDQGLTASFQRLGAGSEVLVFPKQTLIHSKTIFGGVKNSRVRFKKPVRYFLRSIWGPQVNCAEFDRNKKLYSQFFDKNDLAAYYCSAVEIDPEKNRFVFGQDSIVSLRVYFDQRYRAHGVEFLKKSRRYQDPQIIRMGLNSTIALTSGLINFPIDVPNNSTPRQKNLENTSGYYVFKDFYVANKLQKEKVGVPNCMATKFEYRDLYGGNVTTYWCGGDPWPTIIETDKYVSILKRK